MGKIFFISDLHFGHTNIIKYENRPFADTEEMDRELIKRWNSVVSDEDTVWFLGDLSLRKSKTYLSGLVSQLKGHKRMIKGNHDVLKDKYYREMGFEFVSPHPVILKNYFVLSHKPMEWMGKTSPFFYIFGHVHSAPCFKTATENSRCVCCERQGYVPIEIPEFTEYIEHEIEAPIGEDGRPLF